MHNKFSKQFFWVACAVVIGVGSTYVFIEGISFSYGWVKSSLVDSRDIIEAVVYSGNLQSGNASHISTSPENISISQSKIPEVGRSVLADLSTMKIYLYEDGQVRGEIDIVSKGRPGSAWETPPGEYKILTKEENHLSTIGGVWMPYSMQFFGNYFIHGWPYYKNGVEVGEGYSGGCIRLRTEDAKKIFDFVEISTSVYVHGELPQSREVKGGYVIKNSPQKLRVTADSYVVADLDTGDLIVSKDKSTVRPIASISKLITSLVSLEAVNQFRDTTVSKKAVDTYGETGRLVAGEVMEVRELIYPLLLESSNDAAEVIAEVFGRNGFVKSMNNKAKAMNLTSTYFADPSGLSPENVSTAEDLFKLTQYIYKYKSYILEITKKKKHNGVNHEWHNYSKFVNDENYLGGKNGFIDESGHTLITLFSVKLSEFDTRNIAIILLKSDNNEEDARELLKFVQGNVVYEGNRELTSN